MAEPDPPALAMLWETADPHAALQERFGHHDGAAAGRWVRSVLHDHWGLPVTACERVVISDRNALAWAATPSGPVVAKWSVATERFPRLSAVARLTDRLGAQGLPVSAPVPAQDGRLQVEVDGASVGVQHQVAGSHLDTSVPQQVFAAGAALARIHAALEHHPDDGVLGAPPAPDPAARVTTWLERDAAHVSAAARETLCDLLADAPADLPPRQLLHGDFRAANVLCSGDRVVAVLDLEEASRDHCVVELARSSVLLGTLFRGWAPVRDEVRTTFVQGYRSVRGLTPAEELWSEVLALWVALAMVPADGEDPTGWGDAAVRHAAAVRRTPTT